MRERDEGFLGSPQIERGFVLAQGTLQAFDAAVDVGIEQREEPAEVVRIALVWRGRHQQEMVRHLRESFAQTISVSLTVVGWSAHFVGFVHNYEIPTRPQQTFASIFDHRNPRDRRDDLIPFLPWVLPVVRPQHVSANDIELLAKLVRHFPLPLKRQAGRRDDQDSLDQTACFEFLQQQTGHDRLSRAGIVGQQEANARQLHEVPVDRLQLVRQWIDASDRQREERVVLVGQSQPMSFDTDPKESGIAVKRLLVRRDLKLSELLRTQNGIVGQAGFQPTANNLERVSHRNQRQNFDWLRQRWPANNASRLRRCDNAHGGQSSGCLEANVGFARNHSHRDSFREYYSSPKRRKRNANSQSLESVPLVEPAEAVIDRGDE